MLSAARFGYVECLYTECLNAKCHYANCRGAFLKSWGDFI
jgi:hypothetical protein